MKGNRYGSTVPRCPFYKATEQQCVFCEGEEFSSLRISFPQKADRVAYMKQYCEKDFEKCVVYDVFVLHM